MTQCQTFPSPEAIRAWANTTVSKKIDEKLVVVQHHLDKLYYYFALDRGVWVCKMNSISSLGE